MGSASAVAASSQILGHGGAILCPRGDSNTCSSHPCDWQGFMRSTIVGARVGGPVGYDVSPGGVPDSGRVSKMRTPARVTLASHGAGWSATRVSMSSQ